MTTLNQFSRIIDLLFLFLILFNRVYSQHVPDVILRSPILIELDSGAKGSGFYLQDSLHTYLITARHVLIDKIITDPKTQKDSVILSAKTIRCISYPIDPNVSEKVILTVDIVSAIHSGMLKYQINSDISVIQVGEVQVVNDSLALTTYYSFANKNRYSMINPIPRSVIQKYSDVSVGDDVFIFGYPTSIGLHESPQFDYERPLLRHGTIAGKNNLQKTLIIDCAVYYGNSGGPVIVKYSENDILYYKLIGVVTEFIPYEEDWVNNKNGLINTTITNSGYSVVVPIESILDLFKR
ncbi:MAG: trypsin-like peptidase domain-containing protein [Bacteroidota bacterium]